MRPVRGLKKNWARIARAARDLVKLSLTPPSWQDEKDLSRAEYAIMDIQALLGDVRSSVQLRRWTLKDARLRAEGEAAARQKAEAAKVTP